MSNSMSNSWKENLTWKSGLLSEIPVSRWKSIRGSKRVEILVFKKRSDVPSHPGNLALEQILRVNSPPMRKSILDDPGQFVCVAVHLGIHKVQVDCSFTTLDMVSGSIAIHISYKVVDPETLVIGVEDALSQLSLRFKEAVTHFAESNSYEDISTWDIKDTVKQVETDDLGLVITEILVPSAIAWPQGIVEPRSEIPEIRAAATRDEIVTEIKFAREKKLARLLEDKLTSMGITHPAILMRVLSRHDPDYQTILDAAQHFAESQRDNQVKAREFLVWLIEQGKVPRIELEELITGLVGKVTSDVTALPDAVASLLTAPSEAKLHLSDPSSATPSITTDVDVVDKAISEGQTRDQSSEQAEAQEERGSPGHSIVQRRPPQNLSHSGKEERGHSYIRRQREPKP